MQANGNAGRRGNPTQNDVLIPARSKRIIYFTLPAYVQKK